MSFLEGVLGVAGAAAFARLDIGAVPARAALAWVQSQDIFEGRVPGTDVDLVLRKTEDGYSGVVGSAGKTYAFQAAPAAHAAAALLAMLGVVPSMGTLRPIDMARLGKTVDILVKAQLAPPKVPTAQPEPVLPPVETPRPRPQQRGLRFRISKAVAERACGVCGVPQFRSDRFEGCTCLQGLEKNCVTTPISGGYEVAFGRGWDRDDVIAIFGGNND